MPTPPEIQRMMSEDIPESVKEGVNLGLYTLDEALEMYHTGRCSSNTEDLDTPRPKKRKNLKLQALRIKKLKAETEIIRQEAILKRVHNIQQIKATLDSWACNARVPQIQHDALTRCSALLLAVLDHELSVSI
jgi:hypothetical protein